MAKEAMYADALRQDPSPQPEMLGTGMAAQAGTAIRDSAAYKRYATEAAMNGDTPKSLEEWRASRK